MKTRESQTRRVAVFLAGAMLFGLLGQGMGWGGTDSAENKFNKDFFIRFGKDFQHSVSTPFHWGQNDFLRLAAISGIGLLLYSFDQDIYDWVQKHRTPSSKNASSVFSYFGNGAVLLGVAGALYAVGEINHQDAWRKTALLSVESLATASILVWGMKAVTGRARPQTGQSSHSFHPFSLKSSFWSLPSGHAASAFAVAAMIAEQTDQVAVDVFVYGAATLVGLSRIHDDKHWASDVFIGSAIGYFVAKKISGLNRPQTKKSVSFGFQFSPDRQALTLSIEF
jgi:membrane-associated phospholipid phosphatase